VRTWSNLIRDWRASRWVAATWLGVFALFAAMGAWFVAGRPELRLIYFPPVAFLALTLPVLFFTQFRRERALLMLITQEAPELSKRLKTEGIG